MIGGGSLVEGGILVGESELGTGLHRGRVGDCMKPWVLGWGCGGGGGRTLSLGSITNSFFFSSSPQHEQQLKKDFFYSGLLLITCGNYDSRTQ